MMRDATSKLHLDARDFDIETLGLDDAIDGSEGLNVNDASRLRMQFLTSQHASLVTQTQFADAKAAALITALVLIAMQGPVKLSLAGPPSLVAMALFGLMILTVLIALTALIPRYPDRELNKQINRRERFSWPSLVARGYEPLAHAEFLRDAEAAQLIMSIAQTNGAMARVLQKKFRSLRVAFLCGTLYLVLLVGYVASERLS